MYRLSQRWLILILLNAAYFFVYFHRTSTAVLTPYLMEAFSTTGASLGGMSSAYFYPYALCQPMVGLLTDRWGSRKVATLSTLLGSVGAVLFGCAPTLLLAAVGRALIGLGAAGVFIPTIKILLSWFGPRSFARMNAFLLAVGNTGAIVSSTPYAWFVQQIGWRSSFLVIAAVTLSLSCLCWTLIRDIPLSSPPAPAPPKPASSLSGEKSPSLWKNPFFWLISSIFFTFAAPTNTLQGLWGYPYLTDVLHCDKIQASNLIMLIAFGVILGGPVIGYLADKTYSGHKPFLLSCCIALQACNWSGLVFWGPDLSSSTHGLIFFSMGMAQAGTIALNYAMIREVYPQERMGTATGLINLAPFLGVAIYQPFTGYLMDQVGKVGTVFPFAAYQRAFAFCLFSIFLALVLSRFLVIKKNRS